LLIVLDSIWLAALGEAAESIGGTAQKRDVITLRAGFCSARTAGQGDRMNVFCISNQSKQLSTISI